MSIVSKFISACTENEPMKFAAVVACPEGLAVMMTNQKIMVYIPLPKEVQSLFTVGVTFAIPKVAGDYELSPQGFVKVDGKAAACWPIVQPKNNPSMMVATLLKQEYKPLGQVEIDQASNGSWLCLPGDTDVSFQPEYLFEGMTELALSIGGVLRYKCDGETVYVMAQVQKRQPKTVEAPAATLAPETTPTTATPVAVPTTPDVPEVPPPTPDQILEALIATKDEAIAALREEKKSLQDLRKQLKATMGKPVNTEKLQKLEAENVELRKQAALLKEIQVKLGIR